MRLPKMLLFVFVLSVVLAFTAIPPAATAQTPTPEAAPQASEVLNTIRGQDLLGFEMKGSKGDSLGMVDDVVVALKNGRIRYLVGKFGGFLGLGDKLFAIPWEATTVDVEQGTLTLDVDSQAIQNAPSFTEETWPTMVDTQWDKEILDYWKSVGVPVQSIASTTSSMTLQCGDVIGHWRSAAASVPPD